ncbi:hypothetical protein A2V68_02235 [candidate division Kazan bacterium RBG_13_50_9]|uniref:M23ase beta-sheet core domain-containing protein n=1 Tax=candidate division Kazan bacterium RBG_13_50_9 TaxID=1798535 RepID=A0A1F4NRU2_UNCK3|nr:MAG: hypothetical protein A2V68_02235 [candidate division Kazan bacterium RBG_13_50_9]
MKQLKFGYLVLSLWLVVSSAGLVQANLLEDKQLELKNLQSKIEEQEKALEKVRKQRLTLDNQVKLLDQQIDAAHLSLEALEVEIVAIELEKKQINHDLVDLEEQALDQRLVLQQAIRAAYLARRDGLLEILISSNSLAEFMTHLEYLDRVQHHISVSIKTLNELKKTLAIEKAILEDKNDRLDEVRSAKQVEQQSLQIQFQAKDKILKEFKLTEAEYQQRVDASRTEQQAVANEIAALIRSTGKRPPVAPGEMKLAWPIPYRTITAAFHDSDYQKQFGLVHTGMDIAAPHGTPVAAPANGTVTKVKQGEGNGLSYLVIAHDNGLSTVYLHLSGFAVSPGAYVVQGQTIGYSGGTPGTPGAGWLTTGPHLHFEVWYDGQARNPLAYLV